MTCASLSANRPVLPSPVKCWPVWLTTITRAVIDSQSYLEDSCRPINTATMVRRHVQRQCATPIIDIGRMRKSCLLRDVEFIGRTRYTNRSCHQQNTSSRNRTATRLAELLPQCCSFTSPYRPCWLALLRPALCLFKTFLQPTKSSHATSLAQMDLIPDIVGETTH